MEPHDQTPEHKFDDRPSTRRSFLRRAGMTLAVGLGFAIFPAQAAAGRQECCLAPPDGDCYPSKRYYCTPDGPCPGCYICQTYIGDCFSSQYCICGP